MYDILVYLFENCPHYELFNEKDRVAKKLSAAGFDDSDISEALTWLAGVVRGPHRSLAPLPDSGAAFRAYAPKELAKLDAECRGLLIYFEQSGILTPQTRERVLMVLWNQQTPGSRLVAEDLLSPATARLPS